MKKITWFLSTVFLVTLLAPVGKIEANTTYYYIPSTNYSPINYQVVPTNLYSYGTQMTEAELINYLRLLIIQLQAQLASRQTNYYDYSYGYEIGVPRSRTSNKTSYYYDYQPTADTLSANYIDRNSARLRGEIDMNDFRNGIVFFVYGESRSKVENIENNYSSYNSVRQDDRMLQKIRVDSNLSNKRSYEKIVDDLRGDTQHYYQICVEFYDDGNNIICGGISRFTTSN